jgi:hypothetical protein
MANRNTKRRNNLARKARAAVRWELKLRRDADKHKNTIKGK